MMVENWLPPSVFLPTKRSPLPCTVFSKLLFQVDTGKLAVGQAIHTVGKLIWPRRTNFSAAYLITALVYPAAVEWSLDLTWLSYQADSTVVSEEWQFRVGCQPGKIPHSLEWLVLTSVICRDSLYGAYVKFFFVNL